MALQIDVISDVVCPWCFTGKRRLEAALALYREKKTDAPEPELVFHPFDLNPGIAEEGVARKEYVARKFGEARGAHDPDILLQAMLQAEEEAQA